MDVLELAKLFPNLAFGIIALWFVQQVQKERVAENARYAASLEKINELYMELLEKAVTAIANNAALSAHNGDTLAKLLAEFAAFRADLGGLRDGVNRFIRDSTKRDKSDSRGSQSGASAD